MSVSAEFQRCSSGEFQHQMHPVKNQRKTVKIYWYINTKRSKCIIGTTKKPNPTLPFRTIGILLCYWIKNNQQSIKESLLQIQSSLLNAAPLYITAFLILSQCQCFIFKQCHVSCAQYNSVTLIRFDCTASGITAMWPTWLSASTAWVWKAPL